MKKRRKKKNHLRSARTAALSYVATHWGEAGNGEVVTGEAVDVHDEDDTLVALGLLTEIVYTTIKGGDKAPTEYEHHFSKRNPPLLAYGQKSGKLVIVSPKKGGYFVSVRGIVG